MAIPREKVVSLRGRLGDRGNPGGGVFLGIAVPPLLRDCLVAHAPRNDGGEWRGVSPPFIINTPSPYQGEGVKG